MVLTENRNQWRKVQEIHLEVEKELRPRGK